MSAATSSITNAAIRQSAKRLHLPTLAAESARLAEQATKEQWSYLSYLEALLEAEVDERDRHVIERRLKEARLPAEPAGKR